MEYQSKDKCMTKQELESRLVTEVIQLTFVSPWDRKTRTGRLTLNEELFDSQGVSKTNEKPPSSQYNRYAREPDKYLVCWSLDEEGWRTIAYNQVKKVGIVIVRGLD